MLKKIGLICIIILAILSIFVALKNIMVRRLLEDGIEKTLGLAITIEDLDVSPLGYDLRLEGIEVYSPEGFSTKKMAYLPKIELYFDLYRFIKTKTLRFYLMEVDLKWLVIEKNKEGKYNIEALIPKAAAGNKAKEAEIKFTLDILRLSVGDVYYLDRQKAAKPVKFSVGIKDALFGNVDDPRDIVDVALVRILSNTELGKLVNVSIAPMVENAKSVVALTGKTIKDTVKGVFGVFSPFIKMFKKEQAVQLPE
jgi:hypothetical protein